MDILKISTKTLKTSKEYINFSLAYIYTETISCLNNYNSDDCSD